MERAVRFDEVFAVDAVLYLGGARGAVEVDLGDVFRRIADALSHVGIVRGVPRPDPVSAAVLLGNGLAVLGLVDGLGVIGIDIRRVVGEQPGQHIQVAAVAVFILLAAVHIVVSGSRIDAAFAAEPLRIVALLRAVVRGFLHAGRAVPGKGIEHIRTRPGERAVFRPGEHDIAARRVVGRFFVDRVFIDLGAVFDGVKVFAREPGDRDDISLPARELPRVERKRIALGKRVFIRGILVEVERLVPRGNADVDEGRGIACLRRDRLPRIFVGHVVAAVDRDRIGDGRRVLAFVQRGPFRYDFFVVIQVRAHGTVARRRFERRVRRLERIGEIVAVVAEAERRVVLGQAVDVNRLLVVRRGIVEARPLLVGNAARALHVQKIPLRAIEAEAVLPDAADALDRLLRGSDIVGQIEDMTACRIGDHLRGRYIDDIGEIARPELIPELLVIHLRLGLRLEIDRDLVPAQFVGMLPGILFRPAVADRPVCVRIGRAAEDVDAQLVVRSSVARTAAGSERQSRAAHHQTGEGDKACVLPEPLLFHKTTPLNIVFARNTPECFCAAPRAVIGGNGRERTQKAPDGSFAERSPK